VEWRITADLLKVDARRKHVPWQHGSESNQLLKSLAGRTFFGTVWRENTQPQKSRRFSIERRRVASQWREWLRGLDVAERRAIGNDLLRAQWRWDAAVPPDAKTEWPRY